MPNENLGAHGPSPEVEAYIAAAPEASRARLQEIAALSAEGVNLIGIARILALETENTRLRQRLAELTQQTNSTALVVWRPHRRA